jgi:methylthioribose-1-phosphate isomerase
MRTIYWDHESRSVFLIDQTKLPANFEYIECKKVDELVDAIRKLKVRGAPALGVAGGYGIVLASFEVDGALEEVIGHMNVAAGILRDTRPTAVNLFYGINRVLKVASTGDSVEEVRELAVSEAEAIAEEDIKLNKLIGKHGAGLLEDGDVVMTYCNAGRLACVEWGTALGVIRSAIEQGKDIRVIACETRPLNQGSRLTTWELMEDGIDVTLITDNMAGFVMKQGKVDKIIVGADRIVDDAVFNKIGTYSLSVLAKEHDIPFYVAAPSTTFDLGKKESDVVIEERNKKELIFFGKHQIAPEKVKVYNPAFDSTPLEMVSAIITEKGVIYPPYARNFSIIR